MGRQGDTVFLLLLFCLIQLLVQSDSKRLMFTSDPLIVKNQPVTNPLTTVVVTFHKDTQLSVLHLINRVIKGEKAIEAYMK